MGSMRIAKIETFIAGNPWKNWLFTKVLTDEGVYGIGEGTLNYFGKTVETAIHELEPLVLGMDPFQIETMSQRLIRDVYSDGGQIHMCAVAAIEIACWDIIGKATNQPVYNLWGGRCHQKLRAYANGWYCGPGLHCVEIRPVWECLANSLSRRFRFEHRHRAGGSGRGRELGGFADRGA